MANILDLDLARAKSLIGALILRYGEDVDGCRQVSLTIKDMEPGTYSVLPDWKAGTLLLSFRPEKKGVSNAE